MTTVILARSRPETLDPRLPGLTKILVNVESLKLKTTVGSADLHLAGLTAYVE